MQWVYLAFVSCANGGVRDGTRKQHSSVLLLLHFGGRGLLARTAETSAVVYAVLFIIISRAVVVHVIPGNRCGARPCGHQLGAHRLPGSHDHGAERLRSTNTEINNMLLLIHVTRPARKIIMFTGYAIYAWKCLYTHRMLYHNRIGLFQLHCQS